MFCKYSIKDTQVDGFGWNKLICVETKEMCNFQYRCTQINNWRNYDNLENRCKIYKYKGDKEYMKQGQYKVLYEKRGKLYIELDYNTSITVINPFKINEIPLGVDLVKIKNDYFIKGFEPKRFEKIVEVKDTKSDEVKLEIEPKRVYNKKDTK